MTRMLMNDRMDEVFNARHAPRALDDTDRNILADLAGEADEPCAAGCGEMVRPQPVNPMRFEFANLDPNGDPLCDECAP